MNWTRRRAGAALLVLPLLFNGVSLNVAVAQSAVPTFDDAVRSIRGEARKSGVSQETLDRVLGGIQPVPGLDRFERAQPESVRAKTDAEKTAEFFNYFNNNVTPKNIQTGRDLYAQHFTLLKQVEEARGVPAHIILAVWGMETRYGTNMGKHPTIPALVTMSRDGRNESRRAMFRAQAIAALKIVDQGYDEILTYPGSWAGAFGHTQFMPDSFLRLAVDGDGDGRKDVWTNLADAFSSTANYLNHHGWKPGERWGREVKLPPGFDKRLLTDRLTDQTIKTPSEWKKYGITLPDGSPLPDNDTARGRIIMPGGEKTGPAYIVYDNFVAIMRYNPSYRYALTVAGLADAIASGRPDHAPAPAPGGGLNQ